MNKIQEKSSQSIGILYSRKDLICKFGKTKMESINSTHIVIFSGAGMSAESGISTFRDTNGLWENNRIEDVTTPLAWQNDPEKVLHFYNLRRKQIIEAQPNEAHKLIAELEKLFQTTIITQNIDDLHERAGSKDVLHLHGNIRFSKSSISSEVEQLFEIKGWQLKMGEVCPNGHQLRPHVVWFGEDVPNYSIAADIIRDADILIIIGTSLNVYPAAGLIHFAPKSALKILIDPKANEFTLPDDYIRINTEAGKGMSQLIAKWLK